MVEPGRAILPDHVQVEAAEVTSIATISERTMGFGTAWSGRHTCNVEIQQGSIPWRSTIKHNGGDDMKHKVLFASLIVLSSQLFAQEPETAPIVILPGNTMEAMPSTLPFDVRSKRAAGDPSAPPATYQEASWLLQDAASTAYKLDVVGTKIAEVDKLGKAMAAKVKVHNDQWPNGCIYPPDNPRACDGWLQEAKELNDEKQKLLAQYRYLGGVQGTLRTHQSIVLTRIRFNAFFEKYTSWEHRVVGCTMMQAEAAQLCLKSAWEQRP